MLALRQLALPGMPALPKLALGGLAPISPLKMGVRGYQSNMKPILQHLEDASIAAVLAAAHAVRNACLLRMTGMKTGRQYRKPGGKTTYTASAPGESPAVVTKELRDSITVDAAQIGWATVEGYVGSPLLKAVFLEKGTKSIEPRPFLKPAFEDSRDEVRTILWGQLSFGW